MIYLETKQEKTIFSTIAYYCTGKKIGSLWLLPLHFKYRKVVLYCLKRSSGQQRSSKGYSTGLGRSKALVDLRSKARGRRAAALVDGHGKANGRLGKAGGRRVGAAAAQQQRE